RAIFVGRAPRVVRSYLGTAACNGRRVRPTMDASTRTGAEDPLMRPKFRPGVEQLEAQTLPSGLLPAVATPTPVPVTLALTTDQAVYQAGQPVHMTLTETN